MHSTRLMRARINERLERASRFPVTLIVAPAGFGKSVALRDFLQTSRMEALRYDVRREDGNLLAFVRRLSEALEPVAPGALASFPAMQERVLAASEPVRHLSDWFAEHLKRTVCTIVIDDLHYAAADPASIALLADLIERTTDRISWIIAARSDVGLPVATWIAYGRMDMPIGEDDLRFTPEEALAAADSQHEIDPQEIEALRELTEGWPVALTIALRTRTHAADLRSASSGTRDMVYRYLAEQVYAALSPEEHRFTQETCIFSSFSGALAESLGYDAAFVAALRAKVAFLNEIAPGEYRYHDLFRDFLEAQLRRSGEAQSAEVMRRGAAALEQRGDTAGALALYLRAAAFPEMVAIIERHGAALFARGESEVLASALAALPEGVRAGNAALMGLTAMIEAARGRYELSDHAFRAAIEAAGAELDLRARLVQRYGTEMVRRGLDCTELLKPYSERYDLEPSLRATILGTLATAFIQHGRETEALVAIDAAMHSIAGSAEDATRARVLQQAAYVHLYARSIPQARSYAGLAIDAALKFNMYEVAARAYSILYTISSETDGDPIAALSILDKLGECARKSASSQARMFALIGTYEIEMERGNIAAIERLDPLVRESRAIYPQAYAEGLLPADALRAAWSGDFRTAYDMLSGTAPDQRDPERRALRWAEIALYAAAAEMPEAADEAFDASTAILHDLRGNSRRVLRAQLLLCICEMLRGHNAAAHQRLTAAERSLPPGARRFSAFVNAVRATYRSRLGQTDGSAVSDGALERMRAENFGGIARLLTALPLREPEQFGYAALTGAERDILQLLAKGASSKDIAQQTGRSPHTVDTHVRAICRKLQCSGRREAIALATGAGWVQA